jgi:hypothetical protein
VFAVFNAVATPYWASEREPVVPALDKYMVSVVIAMVTALADKFTKLTAVPVAYDTELLAGIV